MRKEDLKEIPRIKLELAANQNVRERDFWLRQLSGDLVKSNFPFDYQTNDIHEGNMNQASFSFPGETCSRLLRMSKGSDYALNAILVSGLTVLLNKYTHSTDIIIGTPIYKHNRDNENGLINTLLPIRTRVEDHLSFKQLLMEVSRTIRQAIDHYNYPLEILAKKLDLQVSEGHFPFFDIALLLRNIHDKDDIKHISSFFIFDFTRTENSIHGVVEFDSLLYDSSTIKRIITHFTHLLVGVLVHMDLPIAQIDILTQKEKKQLLVDFNHTAAGYPRDKTIVELFKEQVETVPNSIALVFENKYYSYKEIEIQSNCAAHVLKTKGVQPDTIVGIMAERSIGALIGILGILKAGGAYLPIDPGYTAARIKYILEDGKIKTLVNENKKFENPFIEKDIDIVFSDEASVFFPGKLALSTIPVTSLAYVMYTSGTTGQPKGVMVEHRSVVRLVKNTTYIDFTKVGKMLQTGALEFDASTFEIWGALLNGLTLYVISKEKILLTHVLGEAIEKYDIGTMWLTAPWFNQVVDSDIQVFHGLKNLLVGGDILSVDHINRVRQKYPEMNIINGYGPTENTTFSTTFLIDREYTGSIPIGSPISASTVYILDKNMNLVPLGVTGELLVGGVGLSRGYLNQPQLTAEKFKRVVISHSSLVIKKLKRTVNSHLSLVKNKLPKITNDHSNKLFNNDQCPMTNDRLYKTGDLARWLGNGTIEFLGRVDDQVKIRGFRIEPGEVEYLLLKHEKVKEATVMVSEDESREKYLCAYIVPAAPGAPAPVEAFNTASLTQELKTYLSLKTADFMIPRYFVLLEKIPLNPNGKVDRRALPAPAADTGKTITPPQTILQQKLVEIWADVLMIEKEKIGIDSDFFQLGGHSLKATVLVSRIHKLLHVEVPLGEIFKTPTIKELSAWITSAEKSPYMPLFSVEKKEYYRLSSAQKRLYVLQQMELANTGYNIPMVLTLEGQLNREKLENTLRRLMKWHESLRTSFAMAEEEPVQKIHQKVGFEIEYYQVEAEVKVEEKEESFGQVLDACGGQSPKSQELRAKSYIDNFIRPFDLSRAPLLRVGLIQEQEQKHILMIDMHHIVTDGTSMELFVKESTALYAGEELPPLKFQYKDYSQWQNTPQQKKAIKAQEEYWLNQFADEVPVLNLPLDYPRPAVQSFEGDVLSFDFSAGPTGVLNQLALDMGITLYMVLLAIYNILLSKISGQEDIVVGTPIAARRHTDLERIIGMFVNTLAPRNYPDGEKTAREFLEEIKKSTLQAFENQEYPFEDLVEQVSVNRDTSRNPLFDTMFALQNIEARANEIPIKDIPQLRIRPYETENRTAKFDLSLTCIETGEKLLCSLEYCTKLFRKETIERFIIYFQQILSAVLENPDQKISQIEIITTEEKRQILEDFNDTAVEYPGEKTIHQLFAEQVERTPDNTALVDGNPKFQIPNSKHGAPFGQINAFGRGHLSYRELNEKSNQLAGLLIEKGVKPDTIVGIMLERSLEMIIGILGILKAGGAYLPIDPDYPQERIQYMLKDSNAQALVVDDTSRASWSSFAPKALLNLSEGHHLNFPASQLPSFPASLSSNLAYVIYTSGSTGNPKGVLITHDNFSPLMHWGYRLGVSQRDRAIQNLSYHFDWSVWEIFIVLTSGAALYMITNDILLNPEAEVDFILENAITVLHITPGQYQYLIDVGKKLKTLKYLFMGAEKLTVHLVKRSIESVSDHCRIFNMYGPTEATIISSVLEIHCQGVEQYSVLSSVPIGKPVGNMVLLVLDRHLTLCPINITGQLYIAGDGVAKGYLNKPALTFERFISYKLQNTRYKQIPNYKIQITNKEAPFGRILNPSGETTTHHSPLTIHHSPIYRTGDLCRRLPDGNIEFLGRLDDQVKIRGFRIELGEIESQLLAYDGIKEAVVEAKTDERGDKTLCAYLVSQKKRPASELREFLSGKLPGYMIPTYFVFLESIPLIPNGKVDRKALPEPGMEMGQSYIAPGNKIEKKLVEIWSELLFLEKEKISIDANFFQLGGHSLKAAVMTAKVHKELHVTLPMTEIFKTPNIKGLSRYIQNQEKKEYTAIEPTEKKEYYVLSAAQKRLYILQQIDPDNTTYNMPESMIMDEQLEIEQLEKTFNQLIQRHESLRTSFHMIEEEPVQIIHDHAAFKIEYHGGNKDNESEESVINHFIRPFDLSKAPLIRVSIVETGNNHLMLVDMHHIISDGVSHQVLVEDFTVLLMRQKLLPLRLQYKDYSQWQSSAPIQNSIKKQENSWMNRLAGDISVLNLPTDYPRPNVQSFAGKTAYFEIDKEKTEALNTLALEENKTLFMVLLAIFNILLSKLSNQEDIIIGTPVSGRRHADLEKVIGMFVNTLALRNYPEKNSTFTGFLEDLKQETLNAFENQEYPLDTLLEKLKVTGKPGHHPLFDVMFTLDNIEEDTPAARGAEERREDEEYRLNFRAARADMTWAASQQQGQLYFSVEYAAKLFKKETILRFIGYFEEIIAAVIKDKHIQLNGIQLHDNLVDIETNDFQEDIEEFEF